MAQIPSLLEDAVKRLADKEKGWKEFLPKPGAPQPDSAGRAQNMQPAAGMSGGDLAEPDYKARTYHARKTLKSTDGLLTWLYDPIKTVSMVDAKNNPVTLTFAEPKT